MVPIRLTKIVWQWLLSAGVHARAFEYLQPVLSLPGRRNMDALIRAQDMQTGNVLDQPISLSS